MKITVKKQVDQFEEVEINVPAYFADDYREVKITENGITKVSNRLAVIYCADESCFNDQVKEVITTYKPSAEKNFNQKFNKFLTNVDFTELPPVLAQNKFRSLQNETI